MKELIIVTGGTGGIGRCVAQYLGDHGYVPVIGHRGAKSQEAQEIANSSNGIAMVLDMDDLNSIDSAIETLAAQPLPVAGVVLCASPAPVLAPFGKITSHEHDKFWKSNVVGPHHLLASLVRSQFRRRKTGSVVGLLTQSMNTGAENEEPKAMSSMGAYNISKYGLMGVLAQLRGEFPWLNVKSFSPGFTETSMLDVFDKRLLDQWRSNAEFNTPENVAKSVIELLKLTPESTD